MAGGGALVVFIALFVLLAGAVEAPVVALKVLGVVGVVASIVTAVVTVARAAPRRRGSGASVYVHIEHLTINHLEVGGGGLRALSRGLGGGDV